MKVHVTFRTLLYSSWILSLPYFLLEYASKVGTLNLRRVPFDTQTKFSGILIGKSWNHTQRTIIEVGLDDCSVSCLLYDLCSFQMVSEKHLLVASCKNHQPRPIRKRWTQWILFVRLPLKSGCTLNWPSNFLHWLAIFNTAVATASVIFLEASRGTNQDQARSGISSCYCSHSWETLAFSCYGKHSICLYLSLGEVQQPFQHLAQILHLWLTVLHTFLCSFSSSSFPILRHRLHFYHLQLVRRASQPQTYYSKLASLPAS